MAIITRKTESFIAPLLLVISSLLVAFHYIPSRDALNIYSIPSSPYAFSAIQKPTPTLSPQRQQTITYTETNFHWLLLRWSDSTLVCNIYLTIDTSPTYQDIAPQCGYDLAEQWQNSLPCSEPDNPVDCTGLYLRYLKSHTYTITEVIDLPKPQVVVNSVNCPVWGTCNEQPRLSFSGYEPAEGEHITDVHVQVGNKEYDCEGEMCLIELPVTEKEGVLVNYWAESSYGDQSDQSSFRPPSPNPAIKLTMQPVALIL